MYLRIRDDGIPFDPLNYEPKRNEGVPVGGIALLKKMTSNFQYMRVLNMNNTIIELDRGLQTYGLREGTVRFATGENEKPFLPDYPQIHFNIAHSEQMVIAVFAPLEVGCDIEYMAEIDLALAQRFFCPAEYAYILGQEGDEAKKNAFYRLWTLKGSFMKATGLGMLLPLADFCISIDAKISVHQQVDDASYIFREYPSAEYRIAICLRQEKSNGLK